MSHVSSVEVAAGFRFFEELRTDGVLRYICELRQGAFSGAGEVDWDMAATPDTLFREIARDWRGWSGSKNWIDGSNLISISAFSTMRGPVRLRVRISERSGDLPPTLRTDVFLESAHLDRIASEMTSLFETVKRARGY